jgi:hypothetical protein
VVQDPDSFNSLLVIFAIASFGKFDFNRREQQLLEVAQLSAVDRKFKLGRKSFFQDLPEAFPARVRADVRRRVQVVGENYVAGAGDPVETVALPFEFIDVRKYNPAIIWNFDVAVISDLPFDQLAVLFDPVDSEYIFYCEISAKKV